MFKKIFACSAPLREHASSFIPHSSDNSPLKTPHFIAAFLFSA
jgi:hypothetical protein